jgi:DNA-directed RNA polymerase specialized sigma24 family protein
MAGEVQRRLAGALAELPDRPRIVVTLRDVEGYTNARVRDLLHYPRPTSGSGRIAAERRLVEHLADCDGCDR